MIEKIGKCPVCAEPSSNDFMPCLSCEIQMKGAVNIATCKICAMDLVASDNPCPRCRDENRNYDELNAIGYWHGALREWISMLKYGGDARLAIWPAMQLTRICLEKWPDAPIVPVPPRRARLFKYGIDPVGLIARNISRKGLRIENLLKRCGSNTQKSLNRIDRLKQGALKYELRNKSKRITGAMILFDDVTTSGATLDLCAQILKSAGADRIFGLVVCRD